MEEDGLTATVYEVAVAVEHNPDGSVTICEELVDELLALKTLPVLARKILARPERNMFGKIVHKVE